MPVEIRWFIRTSLCFFAASLLLGAAMVAWRHLLGGAVPWPWVVVHTHLALVGGMLLMIVGVALWMFPLDRGRFPDARGRYDPVLARTCYALLTGGLLLRAVVEPLAGDRSGGLPGILLVAAAASQVAGFLAFLFSIWTRVRAVGTA